MFFLKRKTQDKLSLHRVDPAFIRPESVASTMIEVNHQLTLLSNRRRLSAILQAIHGIDRFWKANEFGRAIPLFRTVEPSRANPYLAAPEAMLPETYQRMEWFGALELVLPTKLDAKLIVCCSLF